AGEIVAIAGVSGNGQSELVHGLSGLRSLTGGEIILCGQHIEKFDICARRHVGLSYIPEDRQRAGLALHATVSENANAGRED
ncbi:ATP-binding cassette domain-containing protein, partial [Aeromonas veronii]|uniref:ATP-binding cassette domain-containing protein n=1 Tax=Aeromonas veronii TaxID=654 RepID=UPI00406C014C